MCIRDRYVEGAMWDQSRRALTDLPPGQLYKPMNVINFIPTNAAKEIEEGTYLCPVYKTAERQGVLTTTGLSSNFILAVELPCAGDKPDKWTLRGAALITEITN
eukprot:TRINITY_DN12574_c0_g1_i5.p1 TRINITY_DN12574_c0_g1~~TRINITY_DN12574_c0_g1_i5.p1  ORF type:complete len:104 (+),score=27.87 TRINITY_DN12574_c0_g1_i5:73-384(+)